MLSDTTCQICLVDHNNERDCDCDLERDPRLSDILNRIDRPQWIVDEIVKALTAESAVEKIYEETGNKLVEAPVIFTCDVYEVARRLVYGEYQT